MAGDLVAGCAAISRFIDSAAWSGNWCVSVVGWPADIPERSIDGAWIVGIESYIDGAGVFIFVKNARPALAAIGCAIDTALCVWTKTVAERCHEHDVRVFRID